eukprot:m.238066 g.238066  ORF g.238066 m.238066 type:complete len:342 (+) comp54346_c0_seq1:147-1172(+)
MASNPRATSYPGHTHFQPHAAHLQSMLKLASWMEQICRIESCSLSEPTSSSGSEPALSWDRSKIGFTDKVREVGPLTPVQMTVRPARRHEHSSVSPSQQPSSGLSTLRPQSSASASSASPTSTSSPMSISPPPARVSPLLLTPPLICPARPQGYSAASHPQYGRSFGITPWVLLDGVPHGVFQISRNKQRGDLKIDPFRGPARSGESPVATALRETCEGSFKVFDLTGLPTNQEALFTHETDGIFQVVLDTQGVSASQLTLAKMVTRNRQRPEFRAQRFQEREALVCIPLTGTIPQSHTFFDKEIRLTSQTKSVISQAQRALDSFPRLRVALGASSFQLAA